MFDAVILLFLWLSTVSAHGFVHTVVLNNQPFEGWNPFTDPYESPLPTKVVRKVKDDGPVSSSEPDLACNHLGTTSGAGATADVAAGSEAVFQWEYWPADHQGPVSTYMASCNGACSGFSANDARWFKLDAEGYYPDQKLWAADKLRNNNNSWTSQIPADLAPGEYLIRHEIVALHSNPAQFYPSCTQVRVSGTGTGVPSDSDLVSIPGLYDAVVWPDIYSGPVTFTVPGPPPVSFGGEQGGSKTSTTTTAATPNTSGASTPTPTSASCSISPSRQVKRRLLKRGHH